MLWSLDSESFISKLIFQMFQIQSLRSIEIQQFGADGFVHLFSVTLLSNLGISNIGLNYSFFYKIGLNCFWHRIFITKENLKLFLHISLHIYALAYNYVIHVCE